MIGRNILFSWTFLVTSFLYQFQSTSAITIYAAVIVDTGRSDIIDAVNKAAADINNDTSVLNGHTLVLNIFNTSGSDRFSIIKSMCLASPAVNYDAVIDVTSTPGRCASLSIAQHYDAAFMSSMGERCFATDVPSVRFADDFYFRALALIALRQNATRDGLTIFYDDSFDIGTMLPMEDVDWYVPSYMFKIPSTSTEMNTLMAKVKKDTESSEFIIAATAANAAALLTSANSQSMISSINHWFVVTRDLDSFSCSACGTNEVIWVTHKILDSSLQSQLSAALSSTWSTLSYRRLDAIYAYEAVRSISKTINGMVGTAAFNSTPSFQCYTASNATLSRYNNFITNLKSLTSYNSVVSAINFNGKILNNQLTLGIYQCTSSGCTDTGATYSSLTNSISGGTFSFTYRTTLMLDVIAIHEPPFVYKNSDGTYEGYSVATLNYIAKALNFNYTIRDPTDASYGTLGSDGTWSGMIGEVARGHADVALGAFTITAERDAVVDFTIPYYDYAGLQILMKNNAGGTSTSMFYFLTVFTGWVWLCVGATLVITGILVTVFDKISPYSYQNRLEELEEGEPEGKVFNFKESMWFVLGAYTQAGESFDPRATSTRMLVAGFWIFSCIMMAMYTANLAAFLTVSKLSTSITSISGLTAQTDIKYTVTQNTAAQTFFQRMKTIESKFFDVWKDISIGTEYTVEQVSHFTVWEYPIEERYTDMYDRMTNWGFASSTSDALAKIRDGWAVFMETPMIKYYIAKNCDLSSTGEILGSRPYGIVLPNKSPLTRPFSMIILEMQRDRIMETYKVYWWDKEKVSCPTVDTSSGIKLETLGGVFIFLASGIGLGLVMLLIEIIISRTIGTERFKPTDVAIGARPASAFNRSQLSIRMHSPRPLSSRLTVRNDVIQVQEITHTDIESNNLKRVQEQDIDDLINATITEYEKKDKYAQKRNTNWN